MGLKKYTIFFYAFFLVAAIFSLRADPNDLLDTSYTPVVGLTQSEMDNIVDSVFSQHSNGTLSPEDLSALYQDINLSNKQISNCEPIEINHYEPRFLQIPQNNIPKTTSFRDGVQQRRNFMDQARAELDNNRHVNRDRRKKTVCDLLYSYRLNAIHYIGIAEIPPEKTYDWLMKLSKSEVIEIKKAMKELKDKFCHGGDFREKAKFRKIKCFKTKKRWFFRGRNYYAIERFADHVIENSEFVICSKSCAESSLRCRIKKQLTEALRRIDSRETMEKARRVADALAAQQKNDCEQNSRIKNYKEILQAHRSQSLGGDDLSKKKLVDYGEKLLENFDANDIAIEKLDRVIKTLQNNGAVREKRYQTGEKLKSQGQEYGISPNDIETFSGNELQHYFHEQVVKSLDCSFAISPSELKTLSIGSTKCVYAANVSHEYELADATLGFADSLLYFAKRAGTGILKGGIDFKCAVAYLLGEGELPSDTSSVAEIFAKIKEQPLEGIGDGLEHAVRTLTFGGAIFVSYLLGLEVAAVGITVAKGIVAATNFLEPFSVGISPSGAATLEYSFASVKDCATAAVIALGQAAQGVCEVAEQCGHLFAAGNSGGSGGHDGNNVLTNTRSSISINAKREKHILYGNETGGGHLWPGRQGKSAFPKTWSTKKIIENVKDIVSDLNIRPIWRRGAPGSLVTRTGIPSRYYLEGIRDGVRIRVIVEPAGEGVGGA